MGEGSTLVDRLRLVVPHAALAAATVLAAVTLGESGLRRQPFGLSLVVAAVTAGWILWLVTLHPRWQVRRRLMAVFFTGLVALAMLLIWTNPLYGFFAWTGYLLAPYALRGRWVLLGASATGTCTAISQVGGFGPLASGTQWGSFAIVLAFNLAIGTSMTFLSLSTDRRHAHRATMLDELGEANRKLAAAMQENAGLHTQLLVQAREAGVLDERQRLAGEIHDVLAQGLTGIVTQLEAAEQAEDRPADRRRHVGAARRLARDSLTEARRSVRAMRPAQLDTTELPEALREVVDGWAGRHGVRAELITTGDPRPLLPEIEATLLRTAQEALTNVARHAAAGRVALTLSYMEDLVTLDVRDDGAGFDPGAPRGGPASHGGGGYGLTAMRERVRRIAGTLEIESEPGAGTAISACVPALRLEAAA
ncbi:sensor histidine kinase [Actinoplanes sp. NPDC051494]|uniref:sensor histidine kinase n=1 Tax=Actinoplanes sp. NPDC051494 TaxID=3363907 RepID=UPI0037A2EA02